MILLVILMGLDSFYSLKCMSPIMVRAVIYKNKLLLIGSVSSECIRSVFIPVCNFRMT